MIGDAALPDDMDWQPAAKGNQLPARWPDWLLQGKPRPSGRIAFCTRKDVSTKDSPLLPSGLLGPVRSRPAALLLVPGGKSLAGDKRHPVALQLPQ